MAEALGKVVNMMENLLEEYGNQDKQLQRIHGKLSYLKYGYNSLKHRISTIECTMSERLGVTSNAAMCLETLKENTETKLCDIETCLDEAQSQLDFLTDFLHPCGEGNWRLVVKHDYSLPASDACPTNWIERIMSGRRFCQGKSVITVIDDVCDATIFDTGGEYSRVCGRVRGYGESESQGFLSSASIDNAYVEGVSVTYNDTTGTRQHVWTFAAGLTSVDISSLVGSRTAWVCPCVDGATSTTPSFVGKDYFCESAYDVSADAQILGEHNLDDSLWDGRQCPDSSNCCDPNSDNNDEPPFFVKGINPTSSSLELRVCNMLPTNGAMKSLLIEEIEFYVE